MLQATPCGLGVGAGTGENWSPAVLWALCFHRDIVGNHASGRAVIPQWVRLLLCAQGSGLSTAGSPLGEAQPPVGPRLPLELFIDISLRITHFSMETEFRCCREFYDVFQS